MTTIIIKDLFQDDKVLTRREGIGLHPILLDRLQNLPEGDVLVVDFSEREIILAGFWDSAFGELYAHYSSAELNRMVGLENLSVYQYDKVKWVLSQAWQYYEYRNMVQL